MRLDRSVIRRGIVAFWAVWFVIVFATNFCDGLKSLGLLPQNWAFASGNYQFMQTVTGLFHAPEVLTAVLFLGVILWEGLASVLFWRAVYVARVNSRRAGDAIRSAFASGLSLWAAFALADEIFIAYAVEASHLRLFIAQLVSLLFLELIPDD